MFDKIKIVLLILILVTLNYSAFLEKPGVIARAMGGSYESFVNSPEVVFYNPANVVEFPNLSVSTSYQIQYAKLENVSISDGYLAAIQPILQSRFGVGLGVSYFLNDLYKEMMYVFSAGYKFGVKPFVSLGINLKMMNIIISENEYTKIDPVLKDMRAKYIAGADAGILFVPTEKFRVGLMIENLNQPNQAFTETASDPLPLKINLSVSSKITDFIPTLGVSFRNKKINGRWDIEYKIGGEASWLDGRFGIRGGITLFGLNGGLFYKYLIGKSKLTFNYSFFIPVYNIRDNFGHHQLGVQFDL